MTHEDDYMSKLQASIQRINTLQQTETLIKYALPGDLFIARESRLNLSVDCLILSIADKCLVLPLNDINSIISNMMLLKRGEPQLSDMKYIWDRELTKIS